MFKMKYQKGFFYPLLFIPTLVFIAVVIAGWTVYKRSHNNDQKKIDASSQTENTTPPSGNGEQQTKVAPSPTPTNPQPPSDTPTKSNKYLKISPWGIKIKYTAEGSYTLKYFINDDDTLYLTTNQLESFAKTHPECSEADRGSLLNRIKPGGYDYTGRQWDESSLKSIQAVKAGGYYYVDFAQKVCDTTMDGVSFGVQQDYILLDQKVPWHDVVEPL